MIDDHEKVSEERNSRKMEKCPFRNNEENETANNSSAVRHSVLFLDASSCRSH